jgi:hypothetical protein
MENKIVCWLGALMVDKSQIIVFFLFFDEFSTTKRKNVGKISFLKIKKK